jgi:hypothetical protein
MMVQMMKWPAKLFEKDNAMNIFAKSMTAIAISALVAGPAAAVEFDLNWVGTDGSIKLSGDNCSVDKDKNLTVDMEMFGDGFTVDPIGLDFDAGPNTGLFDAFVEGVELGEFDGEGTFVIEKRGKTADDFPLRATLGVSSDLFLNVIEELEDYAEFACNEVVEVDFIGCQQTKGHADWSKDGEQLQVKVQIVCKYLDDGGKVKKVQARVVSGKLHGVFPD